MYVFLCTYLNVYIYTIIKVTNFYPLLYSPLDHFVPEYKNVTVGS